MKWLRETVREINYKSMAIYSVIMTIVLLPTTIYIVKKQPDYILVFIILMIVTSIANSTDRWTKASAKKEVKK